MKRLKWWSGLFGMLACLGCADGDAVTNDGGEPPRGPQFRVVDVAILFPLPKASESLIPLTFELDGVAHTLLPRADLAKLQQGDGVLPLFSPRGGENLYERLRVTAVRADPCAGTLAPDTAEHCVRQVRLVVQQQFADPVACDDTSLHLFFEPDDATFVRFVAALHTLGTTISGNPALSVHPTLSAEGLDGKSAERLRHALAAACEPTHLRKITMINAGPEGDDWTWEAVERGADGSMKRLEVPGLDGEGDRHAAMFTLHGHDPFAGDLTPLRDFPIAFLTPEAVQNLSKTQLQAGLSQLDSFLNPTRTDADTVACNGCHVAEHVKQSVLAQRADAQPSSSSSAFLAPAGQNVSGTRIAQISATDLHAFSYAGEQPTILTRVINESAESAAFFELSGLPGEPRPRRPGRLGCCVRGLNPDQRGDCRQR